LELLPAGNFAAVFGGLKRLIKCKTLLKNTKSMVEKNEFYVHDVMKGLVKVSLPAAHSIRVWRWRVHVHQVGVGFLFLFGTTFQRIIRILYEYMKRTSGSSKLLKIRKKH
jgi:hypothetical protein